VLDFAGNTRRLGPVNDPIVPAPRRKGDAVKGEAPVKECPECHSYLHTRTTVCPDCGYVFPPPSTIKKTAAEDDIMRTSKKDTNPVIEEFYVLGIRYKPTIAKTGKYYLRITYSVGTASFHEAMWFDHPYGSTKKNLEKWWTYRGGLLPIPDGVDEAADRAPNELNVPTLIRVNMNTKYKEVVGCDFDPDAKMTEPFVDDDDIPF
jgi:DNA repair protein RadD